MVGPVTVHRQFAPKTAKNQKLYSTVILKSAGIELMLMLWEDAAKWKLPLDVELTLRGKFTRNDFKEGKPSLQADELVAPEGAVEFGPEEVRGEEGKPTLQFCLDAGLRAAKYVTEKNQSSNLAEAAFTFACNAALQGVKPE